MLTDSATKTIFYDDILFRENTCMLKTRQRINRRRTISWLETTMRHTKVGTQLTILDEKEGNERLCEDHREQSEGMRTEDVVERVKAKVGSKLYETDTNFK